MSLPDIPGLTRAELNSRYLQFVSEVEANCKLFGIEFPESWRPSKRDAVPLDKLLPCPFCKSTKVRMTYHVNWGWDCFTPVCDSCNARGPMDIKYKDAAIERWNKARP